MTWFVLRHTEPMSLAVWTGICMFMGSFTLYFLSPEAGGMLPTVVEAAMALFLYAIGTLLALVSFWLAYRTRQGRVAWVALLGWAVGAAMSGVVLKEPQNFYAVSAGIFASLILALAAVPASTST